MKKILILLLPLLALTTGCTKENEEMPAGPQTRLVLTIREEGPRPVMRAVDESGIRDVNVFLFDVRGIVQPQHFYVQGSVVECSMPAGEYEAYVVANLHEDMGAMSREKLLMARFEAKQTYETLPMSGHARLSIASGTPNAAVVVRRAVAKVICNISIDPGVVYGLNLQSVQVVNTACWGTLFTEGEAAGELRSPTPSAVPSGQERKTSKTFYLAENCRGEVAGIVTQQQKCADNAPSGATFVRIRALRGGKQLVYDIYLGENNTTNFDVRRNTAHTLDIRIKGESEVDTRVHALEVTIDDDFTYTSYEFKGYCIYEPDKHLSITVDKPEKAGDLTATIRLVTGQSGAFTVSGQSVSPSVTLPLNDPSGVYSLPTAYVPGKGYTAANYRLVYDVTVSNTDGYSYTKRFSHDFYNLLTVYTYWERSWAHYGRGTLDKDRMTAVKWISSLTAKEYYTRILSLDDGPIMPTQPTDGSVFSGWYADRALTRFVSSDDPYRHPMTTFRDTLYMDFTQESVYIYTDIEYVTISSDKGYRIDAEKQAFAVPPGSRCTLCGTAGKTVAVWWDNYTGHYPRKELSREPEYTFTARENLKAIPEYKAATRNLSVAPTDAPRPEATPSYSNQIRTR